MGSAMLFSPGPSPRLHERVMSWNALRMGPIQMVTLPLGVGAVLAQVVCGGSVDPALEHRRNNLHLLDGGRDGYHLPRILRFDDETSVRFYANQGTACVAAGADCSEGCVPFGLRFQGWKLPPGPAPGVQERLASWPPSRR